MKKIDAAADDKFDHEHDHGDDGPDDDTLDPGPIHLLVLCIRPHTHRPFLGETMTMTMTMTMTQLGIIMTGITLAVLVRNRETPLVRASGPIPSHPIPFHPSPSHPIPSYSIPSYLIPSHPIPSNPSHPIPSHPIPGRELSYILLVGVLLCFGNTFILLAKPCFITCIFQRYKY